VKIDHGKLKVCIPNDFDNERQLEMATGNGNMGPLSVVSHFHNDLVTLFSDCHENFDTI